MPKAASDDPRQRTIDYSRASQLRMIRECEPPLVQIAGPGERKPVGVAPKSLKAVLWCLDEHGRGHECFPSEGRIAEMTKLGLRTVKRAIAALERLSLICVSRRKSIYGVTQNHYRLVWSEIELLCQPGRGSSIESNLPTREPATRPTAATRLPELDADHTGAGTFPPWDPPDQSAVAADQSAVAADQSAVAAPKPPFKRFRNASYPPPAASASSMVVDAAWPAAAAVLAKLRIGGDVIGSWRKILECAAARGLSEQDLLEQIELGEATLALSTNARKFTKPLGALAFFLREGRWPVDGVVTPDEQRERSELEQQQRERQLQDLDRRRAALQAAAEQLEALERDYGPRLDALGPAELDALAANCLDPFLLERFRKTGTAGLLRPELLKALSKGG
jgi:hypothetical protein